MARVFLNMVTETTTTSGLETTVTLRGAVMGYKPFYQAGKLVVGDTFTYKLAHVNTALNQWEVGEGLLLSPNTFQRVSVEESTNNDTFVNFAEGIKYVSLDASADDIEEALSGGGIGSIGLALPAEFAVTDSPLTEDGTITAEWAEQTQNRVFASPNGSAGVPVFRALVAADIPDLSGAYSTPASVTTQINTALTPYAQTTAVNTAIATALTPYLLSATAAATYATPASVGTQIAGATILSSQISGNFAASRIDSGTLDDARLPTTMAGKTLTTPTIASFANANHTHLDAAGGGTLNASAIAAGDLAIARMALALTTPGPIGGTTPSTGRFTQAGIGQAPAAGEMLSITPAAIGNIGIHITGLSGQTGSFGYFQNSDNTARMEITAAMGISSRLASASSGVIAGRVFGDTQPRVNLTANGDFVWTDGTNAEDLRLAREGVGILSTTSVVAATNSVTTTHRFKVNSSGTATNGFGGGFLLQGESSTTNSRNMAEIDWEWINATDASRTGRLSLHAYNGATKQEGLRIDGDATSVKVSLYGVACVARQTVTGSRASGAALADLLTKLASTGIIIDGTSA